MKKKDLAQTPADLRLQIVKARLELELHKIKNTNVVKNLRRKLAQALTYVNA